MSFEARQQLIGGVCGLRIVQSARIKRRRPPQKLHRKDSLLVFRQSLESLQKLGCLTTHISRLSISVPAGKAPGENETLAKT